jgi:two-component system catabolic regulation response regulator CreB
LLLLEDDPAIARTVVYTLERDGLAVTHSLLLRDARQQVQARAFDLLVLDVGLPDGSGLDLLQQVRNTPAPTPGTPGTPGTPSATPVLMLSARGEELDRVLGLELGADDYLTKPFSRANWQPASRRCCAAPVRQQPRLQRPRHCCTTMPRGSASACAVSHWH